MKKLSYFLLIVGLCALLNVLEAEEAHPKLVTKQQIRFHDETYTVIQRLGAGAFGSVYEVENSAGERLALKEYWPDNGDFEGAFMAILGEVEREFRLGQELDHPNIAKTIDYYQDPEQGVSYLVLELVVGRPVFQLDQSSTASEARELGAELVDALQYAYGEGYMYVDLHGGNVMVTDAGSIKVVDLAGFFNWSELQEVFGLADTKPSSGSSTAPPSGPAKRRAARVKRLISENPRIKALVEKSLAKTLSSSEPADGLPSWVNAIYLDQIARFEAGLMAYSGVEKADRMAMRSLVSLPVWSYMEDSFDGTAEPDAGYVFEEISTLLRGQ